MIFNEVTSKQLKTLWDKIKGVLDGTLTVKKAGCAEKVDWENVDNKPSTFTATAHTHEKSEVGLENVDNTADAEKSVKHASTAAGLTLTLEVSKGGTGATSAAKARTNLGLKSAATYDVGIDISEPNILVPSDVISARLNERLLKNGSVAMTGPVRLKNNYGFADASSGIVKVGIGSYEDCTRALELNSASRRTFEDSLELSDYVGLKSYTVLNTGNSAKVVVSETPLTSAGSIRVW